MYIYIDFEDLWERFCAPLSMKILNHFVHFIGVYYLVSLAARSIQRSINYKTSSSFKDKRKYVKIFKLECLLHDVGHAPGN